MTIAFAFEYLLKNHSHKDVVQVPRTLSTLLSSDWYYITRQSEHISEVTKNGGRVLFVGGVYSRRNRGLLLEGRDTSLSFSKLFSIRSGWRAAAISDFYVTMFVSLGAMLGATAFMLGRQLRRSWGFVYIKTDLDAATCNRWERRIYGRWYDRLLCRVFHSWLALVADIISAETTDGRDWIARNFPRVATRVYVVRNCATFLEPENDVVETRIDRQIIAVSRLGDPQKATDILLAAFRLFHKSHPDWRLVLVGPPSRDLEQLLAPYVDMIESGHLRYEGRVTDRHRLSNLYRSSLIFAQPSRFEGNPLAFMEAIRAGCVPVCTPVFPVEDALGKFTESLTVPVDNVDALSARFAELADQPEYLSAIREYLLKRTENWTWPEQLQRVVEAYLAKRDSVATTDSTVLNHATKSSSLKEWHKNVK